MKQLARYLLTVLILVVLGLIAFAVISSALPDVADNVADGVVQAINASAAADVARSQAQGTLELTRASIRTLDQARIDAALNAWMIRLQAAALPVLAVCVLLAVALASWRRGLAYEARWLAEQRRIDAARRAAVEAMRAELVQPTKVDAEPAERREMVVRDGWYN